MISYNALALNASQRSYLLESDEQKLSIQSHQCWTIGPERGLLMGVGFLLRILSIGSPPRSFLSGIRTSEGGSSIPPLIFCCRYPRIPTTESITTSSFDSIAVMISNICDKRGCAEQIAVKTPDKSILGSRTEIDFLRLVLNRHSVPCAGKI